jgi:putative ABC transport system permease protein
MAAQMESGQPVCRLLPQHYVIALVLTCMASVVASGLAGLRSARVEPSEGLREL